MDGFRQGLGTWRPDAIINCVFGQVIDAPIIQAPPLGIYNFHPPTWRMAMARGIRRMKTSWRAAPPRRSGASIT